MKICFLTLGNPEDKRSWSGIFYQMYSLLKKDHEVEWIGTVKFKQWQTLIIKVENRLNRIIKRKKSPENAFFSYCYAENVVKKLNDKKYDVIFAPVSSSLITFLKTSIPIVYLSDATFELMTNYYPQFTGLSKWQIKQADRIERSTYKRAERVILSSDWARNSAVRYYHASPEKVSVFQFGPNLLYVPDSQDLDFSENDICNILFLGVDWVRKGGDKAYKTYRKLKDKGFPCTLTIIGCNPKLESEDADITIIPFLNKNDKNDFDRLYKVFHQTHILLLPSRADCTPVVFSEASAFGIPSLTTNTGGIPSVIKNGINGFLFEPNADESEFANKIHALFTNKEVFKELRVSSRTEYEEKLSWEVWRQNFNKHVQTLF